MSKSNFNSRKASELLRAALDKNLPEVSKEIKEAIVKEFLEKMLGKDLGGSRAGGMTRE